MIAWYLGNGYVENEIKLKEKDEKEKTYHVLFDRDV